MDALPDPFPPDTAGTALPSIGDLPFDLPLGTADQACKECRRRKSKCNRAIPTCNLCVKYRRHCLYEKHSRTPLTRRHLTEVEEKLERAEAMVRRLRALLPANVLPPKAPISTLSRGLSSEGGLDFTGLDRSGPSGPPLTEVSVLQSEPEDTMVTAPGHAWGVEGFSATGDPHHRGAPLPETYLRRSTADQGRASDGSPAGSESNGQDTNVLESPPHAEDFEWDETETGTLYSMSPDGRGGSAGDQDDGASVVDGMASLTVGEREGGYLGVASGAALLRFLEPSMGRRRTGSQPRAPRPTLSSALTAQPNPSRHIADAMIDAYFRQYHLSYPIVHEPTFRAQYSEVIARPSGDSWLVLAYTVAALGVFASSAAASDGLDLGLFARARALLSFNILEVGNLTLVQALTLISNYQQKRDRPNSGYNTLGLAVRMAMGLGLHKEFAGWAISPLNMEIRRRVWWSLCVFDSGATITFSRPMVWPGDGVDVSLPMNVNDRELTPKSRDYPPESGEVTPYTAVATQARFHLATNPIYTRVISRPLPSAGELLRLDEELLRPWAAGAPPFFAEGAPVAPRYAFARAVMQWRYRNFRIIMYRPFVIRRALHAREEGAGGGGGGPHHRDDAALRAYERCLEDASISIASIGSYWATHEHNRLVAWYALYFLFQAALIPCICLRNAPASPRAAGWRGQIATTLRTVAELAPVNPSAARCHRVIAELGGRYLDDPGAAAPAPDARQPPPAAAGAGPGGEYALGAATDGGGGAPGETGAAPGRRPADLLLGGDDLAPIDESPQTQINSVFTMMWPNVPPLEAADLVMGDDAWMDFLRGEAGDGPGGGGGEATWFGE